MLHSLLPSSLPLSPQSHDLYLFFLLAKHKPRSSQTLKRVSCSTYTHVHRPHKQLAETTADAGGAFGFGGSCMFSHDFRYGSDSAKDLEDDIGSVYSWGVVSLAQRRNRGHVEIMTNWGVWRIGGSERGKRGVLCLMVMVMLRRGVCCEGVWLISVMRKERRRVEGSWGGKGGGCAGLGGRLWVCESSDQFVFPFSSELGGVEWVFSHSEACSGVVSWNSLCCMDLILGFSCLFEVSQCNVS